MCVRASRPFPRGSPLSRACSYLDMEVGDGEGDYVSLDAEAWDDFLESRFKRLSVSLDPDHDHGHGHGHGTSASTPAAAGSKDPGDGGGVAGGDDDASATASAATISGVRVALLGSPVCFRLL